MSGWWLASYLVLWGVVALTLVVLLVVLRQLGLIYAGAHGTGGGHVFRLSEGPEIGSRIDALDEIDEVSGEPFHFPEGSFRLNFLLFVSTDCSICEEALRGVATFARAHDVEVLVVTDGEGESGDGHRRLVESPVRFVRNPDYSRALGVQATPHAIVVDEKGVVLEKTIVNKVDHLEELFERTASQVAQARESLTGRKNP